jgi:hypothetical protein
MQHFINHDAKSPDISFWAILMQDQTLRTHVDGTTDANVFEGLVKLNGKSKICNFGTSRGIKEDVGRFEISMNDITLMKIE